MADVPVAEHSVRVLGGDKATNLSASTSAIKSGGGDLVGVHVNSTTSGTLKFYDSLTQAGTVLVNTYSPTLGWNPMPLHFNSGLSVTIGGTIDFTVSYS